MGSRLDLISVYIGSNGGLLFILSLSIDISSMHMHGVSMASEHDEIWIYFVDPPPINIYAIHALYELYLSGFADKVPQ